MNEKIAIIEKYNLWGAETFDFGFKREEYTEKIVDFIAKKADRVIYIQSTYLLSDESTVEREYSALESIGDNFEKIVVSLDDVKLPLRGGIRHLQAWNLKEILR